MAFRKNSQILKKTGADPYSNTSYKKNNLDPTQYPAPNAELVYDRPDLYQTTTSFIKKRIWIQQNTWLRMWSWVVINLIRIRPLKTPDSNPLPNTKKRIYKIIGSGLGLTEFGSDPQQNLDPDP